LRWSGKGRLRAAFCISAASHSKNFICLMRIKAVGLPGAQNALNAPV
jgi:hypothetical protein